jgi:hypothetical protein
MGTIELVLLVIAVYFALMFGYVILEYLFVGNRYKRADFPINDSMPDSWYPQTPKRGKKS